MRLLVVGHSFIVGYNQKKYVAMKQLDPQLQLRIVGPKHSRHIFGTYRSEVHPELSAEEVISLRAVFSGSHMTYVLDPARMAQIIRKFRPDVIHIEEEPQAAITVATVALREAFSPQSAITLFTWDNLCRPRKFPLGALKKALRSYSLRRVAAVVCGNRDAERLLRREARYTIHTEVLPQFGLDPAEHAPGNEPELKQQLGLAGSIVVGTAGRLLPEKGIGLLLGALAEMPQLPWKLLLVGSGPMEKEIREEWIPRFPGRVVLVPAVAHREVPRYLRCLDVFVLASHAIQNWKEQFGLALAQAMLLGIPSVVSSSGALPEVVGPGGLLAEERSQESLRQALEGFLQGASLRQELGTCARAFALEHYTLARVAGRYLGVFEQALRLETSAGREPRGEAVLGEPSRFDRH